MLAESSSQEEMYDTAGAPAVANLMAGYNVSIFAYGQTGAGKTYTMMGKLAEAPTRLAGDRQRGVALRIFEDLFEKCAAAAACCGLMQCMAFLIKC